MQHREGIGLLKPRKKLTLLVALLPVTLPLVVATSTATGATSQQEPEPSAAGVQFFESKVRPLFVQSCNNCHSGAKPKGGLRLDSRAGFRRGGDAGPALVAGDPEKSLLIRAVRYTEDLKMPPKGKLRAQEISDLEEWVKMGAPWPADAAPAVAGAPKPGVYNRNHWSFQPMRAPRIPVVKDRAWVKSPIDAFVLSALEGKGLKPSSPVDRRQLIRRVTFDLTGLPPTPEEVEQFVQDRSPESYSRLIDRLLASPAYGERWGRHWLDVARYADSNGLDENTAFANAWRYRDYVIRAINADKPYDQFLKEQLAGDLLPETTDETARQDRLIATGFLGLGPKVLAEPDKQKMVMDIVDEQIDVTSRAFMGLTLSCARCHDHKFDPIPAKDYYGLASFFKSTKTMATLATVARVLERPLASPEQAAARAEYDLKIKKLADQISKAKAEPAKQRLNAELTELKAKAPADVPMAIAVEDEKSIAPVKVHIRGNHLTLGEEAPRVFLSIIAGDRQTPVPVTQSGRLHLAEWLTRPDHPLTARVMVNRIWQHHFGEGIVRSPDNFGSLGERPTHPELLDWLSREFVARGWSMKAMHRLILQSSTYQMGTAASPKAAMIDPENRLLSHRNRRRLEVEAIRDNLLATSGKLDATMGGSLLTTPNFAYVTNDQSNNGAQYDAPRRSIYLPVIRNAVFDAFQIFDFVEPSVLNGKRSTTTVAPQALFLMNSQFVIAQARAFADRLIAERPSDVTARIDRAYQLAFHRPAAEAEKSAAVEFLRKYQERLASKAQDSAKAEQAAWSALAQVLFSASEFIYVE